MKRLEAFCETCLDLPALPIFVIVLLLAFFAPGAHAQSGVANLTCTPPTTNTDGTPFLAAQLPLQFKFFMGTTTGGPYPTSSPAVNSCAFSFDQLTPGARFFVATAIDKLGISSTNSNQATKAVVNRSPSAPSMLTVGADPTAFVVFTVKDEIVAVEVGKVSDPTAVNCGNMSMNAHGPWAGEKQLNLVPRNSVQLLPSVHDNGEMAVFASCAG